MENLYESELKIPEKSTKVGWVVFIIGAGILAIAIGIGIDTSRKLKEISAKPWEHQETLRTKINEENPLGGKQRLIARVFLLWAIIALLMVTLFILLAILAHRLAMRIKQLPKSAQKTDYTIDAWTEAGQKFTLPKEQNDKEE